MVRLKERDMRLVITQGYKLSEDLFRDLLLDAVDYEIDFDKKKLDFILRNLFKRKDQTKLIEAITGLKELRRKEYALINYEYKGDPYNKRVVSTGNLLHRDWEDLGISLADFVDSDSLGEIICYDFTRLLDWMAYELGHSTYDEELDIQYFDTVFKHQGMFYPCDMEELDKIVPEDFEKELMELLLDTSVNSSYYVSTTKKYYDYFMQDVSEYDKVHKNKGKYIHFKSILDTQRQYLECLVLFYLMIRANSAVIDFKLLSIEHGKIYFILGENKFNKDSYKENLYDPICITLLDRKFEYIPKIIFYRDIEKS